MAGHDAGPLPELERIRPYERVGELLHHVPVHALHDRYDGNQERHADEHTDQGEETLQLLRAESSESHPDRFQQPHQDEVASRVLVVSAWRTLAPSFRSLMAWYVPATMVSPSRMPSSTSKYSSPATPTLTGRNVASPSRTMNTPSASRLVNRSRRVSTVGPGSNSLGTFSWSRTVSATMGMLSVLLRVSVTIRPVQLTSGRMSSGGSFSVISTSKSTALSLEPEAV